MRLASREDSDPAVIVGLRVYDANGELVGTIEKIDRLAGTMQVATNPFSENPLMVPLGLVTSVDARELFLSSSRQTLRPNQATRHDGID